MNTNPLGITTRIRQCSRRHCSNPAAFMPVIRVTAKGCPLPEHEPLAVGVNMPLCEHHMRSVQIGEFLSPRTRKIVKACCANAYKAQPDFTRAFLEKQPLNEA